MADSSFNPLDQMRYFAFGSSRDAGTNLNTDHRFTGQTEDLATGLYWYQSRAYDPAIGRFTQPDTVVPNAKNPQALNRYGYGLNSPVRLSDPTGHYYDDPSDGGVYWHRSTDALPTPSPVALFDTGSVFPSARGFGLSFGLPDLRPLVAAAGGSAIALWQAPTNEVGEQLAVEGGSPGTPASGGAIIHNNVQGMTRLLVYNALGGGRNNAVTVGNHILVAGNAQLTEGTHWYEHEMGHVEQARVLGPLYLPVYGLSQIITALNYRSFNVHDQNPMEILAEERAVRMDLLAGRISDATHSFAWPYLMGRYSGSEQR